MTSADAIARGPMSTLIHAIQVSPNERLNAMESASTLYRFFRSRHVLDLRVIFNVASFVAASCVVILCFRMLAFAGMFDPSTKELLQDVAKFYAAPLLPICCVVIAWAYRSASARLGVVDLFACEITTLCRVGTIFDVATRYVELWKLQGQQEDTLSKPSSRDKAGFSSQEQYFPVFDTNARDLQLLEARVVNNIVAFYTYMKATRDSLRKLSESDQASSDARQSMIADLLYMLYLAFESARKAIDDLVEFEPDGVERTMIVLLTEMKCYAFLLENFSAETLRGKRLRLRMADYEEVVPTIRKQALQNANGDREWQPAVQTAGDLWQQYQEVMRRADGRLGE